MLSWARHRCGGRGIQRPHSRIVGKPAGRWQCPLHRPNHGRECSAGPSPRHTGRWPRVSLRANPRRSGVGPGAGSCRRCGVESRPEEPPARPCRPLPAVSARQEGRPSHRWLPPTSPSRVLPSSLWPTLAGCRKAHRGIRRAPEPAQRHRPTGKQNTAASPASAGRA